MGLIDRLATPAPRPSVKTRIDTWLESLPENEAAAVRAAAIDPAWGHVRLLEVLTAEGMPEMSDNAFGAWRKKQGWKP